MKRSRKVAIACVSAVVVVAIAVGVWATSPVTVSVDGEEVKTSAFVDSTGKTMVPAEIADDMGIDYQINGDSATFNVLGNTHTYATKSSDGDAVAVEKDGTVYIPLDSLAADFGYSSSYDALFHHASAQTASYPMAAVDVADRDQYASSETGDQAEYGWYTWEFNIDSSIDTVGVEGDGIGMLRFRLYAPEGADPNGSYPLVATLGGLGQTNAFADNSYATFGAAFASEQFQNANPCYVLNITVPYEACVNYEAELAYVYEFGEIVKEVSESYGNVDGNRIYATGHSQGAGWCYELASVQPDLLAAMIINAGTTIHTTWGNQCDLNAIAQSGVNTYIWHGYEDPYIPVNEAYRAYNDLTDLGMDNIILEVQKGGHCNKSLLSSDTTTSYMSWMFEQEKGIACTDKPIVNSEGTYADYDWAGVQVLSSVDGWATANPYATWTEPEDNSTWDTVKAQSPSTVQGEGGNGKTWLSKVRIGDETATSYDDATKEDPTIEMSAGDSLAVTVQGYTGSYGDDWDAFNKEWLVDWAVLEGDVTAIELTNEASSEPIVRPDTVTLANGGGPNVNNSLYNENTLDGSQVYVKIDTAQNYHGDTLKVALRFVRDLGDGEYASYWHVIGCDVK